MKRFFLIAALLVSTSAFASNCGNDKPNGNADCDKPPVVTPTSNGSPSNRVTNLQGQLQGQVQGQLQGQNQTATGGTSSASASAGSASTSSANNAGNTQSVTFTAPERSEVRTTGIAPDVISQPTAPCRIAVSASAGWLGGAFGFGGSVLDESCRRIEVSRQLYNMGRINAAVKVMCNEPEAAAALGAEICPPKPQEAAPSEVKP